MTIDPYSICPGGTGKKVKFCCSDLVADLDKIERMLEGDQRIACLDHITKLEAKCPQRACLMAVRSLLEISLDKPEEATATIAAFLAKYPDNPVALARSAVLKSRQGEPREAIVSLLRATEVSGEEIGTNIYQAITAVAINLEAMGYVISARALLLWQFRISRGEDQQPALALYQLQSDQRLPLLLREEPDLEPPPEGAPWKFEFDVAYKSAVQGRWSIAAEKFAALVPLAGQSPALWRNLSLLRGWLGDYPGMVEALRKLSTLEAQPDDAIEAEALAQLIDENSTTDAVEIVEVAYAVANQADVEERFSADRQMERTPFDPRAWESDEVDEAPSPPPRALFLLLDRPIAATAAGLTHDQASGVSATVLLFGRQTDRPERLVVQTERDTLPQVDSLLKRIAGDALGERTSDPEKVVDRIPAIAHALRMDWRLPRDATPEQRAALAAAGRRDSILNRLPKLRLNRLGGQTLEQAATLPAGRIRASALILNLELPLVRDRDVELYNDLRRQLGLPVPGPIDPVSLVGDARLPAARLHRMQAERLSDKLLIEFYRRARVLGIARAIGKMAAELVRRPGLAEQIDFAEPHGLLANLSETLDDALVHVDQARAITQKARQSSARWDLEELSLRIRFLDLQGAARLFEHLRKEHIGEEGVAETLGQILVSNGLVDPSGRLLLPAVAEASPIVVPGAAAMGRILTPDSQPATAERKPVLWTPN
ncbi:MAG TPA: hypothetical protein VGY55_06255 [Pirellulales bacterium]|jgi:hypothetical protein|nr:hypothetical protein [Pirellulales bacterium]